MRRIAKKIISLLLAAVIVFGVVAVGFFGISDLFMAKATTITDYKVGDIIQFGSYPQSKVIDEFLLAELNKLELNWISYDYYSGNCNYGSMISSDYMKYADVKYNGEKYRAVTFFLYRPVKSELSNSSNTVITRQYSNDYYINTVYWFKFEPINWRVIDPNDGLILSESIVDSQPFNNIVYYFDNNNDSHIDNYYSDLSYNDFANDYTKSSIREWLNGAFYNCAFDQTSVVLSASLDNNCWGSENPGFYSPTTNDKVFLLSYNDVKNSEYGFDHDKSRAAKATDYSKCQGLYTDGENGTWWLRSPCDVNNNYDIACYVSEDGLSDTVMGTGAIGDTVTCTDKGIRPALRLDTKLNIPTPQKDIAVGDYITLGTYNDEPILWRCVDIDDNGPLMLSDKILCFKSFDAKGNYGNYYRNKEGTNNWKDSALRHWLNSYGEVDWSGRNSVPSEENVFNGYNAYSDEKGFLTGFTESELSVIKTVIQKTYINDLDKDRADGGSVEYSLAHSSFSESLVNTAEKGVNCYYQYVKDCVFLLGEEQLEKAYENLGADYLTTQATIRAVENDDSKKTVVGQNYHYWIRVPSTTGMSYEVVNVVSPDETISGMSSFSVRNGSTYYSVGVRPAFYYNLVEQLPETHNAIFNIKDENGNIIDTITVQYKKGETIVAPAYDKIGENQTFFGWNVPEGTTMGTSDIVFEAILKTAEIDNPLHSEQEALYVKSHTDFIEQPIYETALSEYRFSKILWDNCHGGFGKEFAENAYDIIEGAFEVITFQEISSIKNPYDVIVLDMLASKETGKSLSEIFESDFTLTAMNIINNFVSYFDEGKPWDDALDMKKEFKGMFFTEESDLSSNKIYKMLDDIIQGENRDSVMKAIDGACNKYKCFDTLLANITDAAKLVDYVLKITKYISAIEAYNNASNEFKKVLADLADEMVLLNEEYGLKFTEAYNDFSTSLDYESIVQNVLNYGAENALWLVADLTSSLLQKTGLNFAVKAFGLEKAAAGKLCAAIWAYEVGFALGDIVTNNSDKINYRRLLRANYHVDDAMYVLLNRYAEKLKQSNSYSDALVFDSAFNLYKHTQLYSVNVHIKYLESTADDWITFVRNKKDDYKREVEAKAAYIDLWNKTNCHNAEALEQQFIYRSDVVVVACPTDVYVYDKSTKELVVSIVNNEILTSDDSITILVINDEKAVCLPNVDNYDVKIVANGDGQMDFRCNRTVDCKSIKSVSFTDVTLKENDIFELVKPIGDDESYLKKADGTIIVSDTSITVNIITPSTSTIKYGDGIVLHADLSENLPASWRLVWSATNGNFDYTVSNDGKTCTITPNKSGDTTFTAIVYDAEGNIVSADTQTMTSKAGFFQKIIAFFKKLFGLTKTIPEAFKVIY